MRICFPTEDNRGLDAALAGHFGRAPYFTVCDLDTKGVDIIDNGHADREHGHCTPVDAIQQAGANAVVCRGLGRGAMVRLNGAGIEVFITDADRVREAIEAFQTSAVHVPTAGDACGGHQDAGGCDGTGHHHHHE